MNNKMRGAQSFTVGRLPKVFDVLPENFKRATADREQEQAAGPGRPLVLAPELRTELAQKRGSGLVFECSDGFAQHDGWRIAQQERT